MIDKFGRPCGVLNLALVGRSEDGGLEGLKEFTRVAWEMGRRWLSDLSQSQSKGKGKEISGNEDGGEVKVQMVVIVNLLGAGMSNLVSIHIHGRDEVKLTFIQCHRNLNYYPSLWTC